MVVYEGKHIPFHLPPILMKYSNSKMTIIFQKWSDKNAIMIFDSPSNNKLSENLLPRTDRQNENIMSLSEKAINLFLVRSVTFSNHEASI